MRGSDLHSSETFPHLPVSVWGSLVVGLSPQSEAELEKLDESQMDLRDKKQKHVNTLLEKIKLNHLVLALKFMKIEPIHRHHPAPDHTPNPPIRPLI